MTFFCRIGWGLLFASLSVIAFLTVVKVIL